MKSDVDLLNDYKAEKALVIGGPDERTGLEDFPSFKEWKADYVKEYNETHQTVSVEEADAMFDAAVEEAENELEAMAVEFDDESTETEDDEMEDVTAEAPAAPAEVPAKPKRAAKKKVAAKKAPAKKTAAKKAPVKKKAATRANSKAAKAQTIFTKFYGKKTRAEIIEKFIAQAGLTANGAATYYQKMKKAAG